MSIVAYLYVANSYGYISHYGYSCGFSYSYFSRYGATIASYVTIGYSYISRYVGLWHCYT